MAVEEGVGKSEGYREIMRGVREGGGGEREMEIYRSIEERKVGGGNSISTIHMSGSAALGLSVCLSVGVACT